MRTSKLHLLAIAFLIGLSVAGCKKSDSSSSTLQGNDAVATQDAESQDAQADNLDQSVDNITDALESNDFSAVKSGTVGAPVIVVASSNGKTPSDTSVQAFPKSITLTFNTDTTINGEKFKQTGTIIIYVERTKTVGPWKTCLKRSISISPNTPFVTANDSASFSVYGIRTMTRKEIKVSPIITTLDQYKAATKLRLSVLDSINSNFTFTVTCGTYTGHFTRVVKKTRQAMAHFEKAVNGLIWHQAFLNDTLTFKGSVTGTNLMDSTYSRVITDSKPIVFTRCASLVPVISSGELVISRNTPKGTKTLTVTYSPVECKTHVTVVNDKGDTKEFDRKVNHSYKKWW